MDCVYICCYLVGVVFFLISIICLVTGFIFTNDLLNQYSKAKAAVAFSFSGMIAIVLGFILK